MVMYALDIIPKQVNELGSDIGSAWPFFVFLGVIWAGTKKLFSQGRGKLSKEIADSIQVQLKPILDEVSYNHGSSMKDSLSRMESSVNHLVEEGGYTNAKIKSLVSNDTTAHYELDKDGNIVYVNQAYLSLMGVTQQEAMEEGWKDRLLPEDLNRIIASSNFALISQSEWGDQFTLKRKLDGNEIKVIAKAFPIFKAQVFSGYVGTIVPLAMFETFGPNRSAS